MPIVTTILDSWLETEIERFWNDRSEERSRALARVAAEWWVLTHLPAIAFRDGVSGRRATLRSGPDVWEVAMAARDYGGDRDGLLGHFGAPLCAEELDQALAYIGRFPEEIEAMIAGNEEAGRNLKIP